MKVLILAAVLGSRLKDKTEEVFRIFFRPKAPLFGGSP